MKIIELHNYFTKKALAIIEQKNRDYTNSDLDVYANFRTSLIFNVQPEIGLMGRMLDKMKRIETFVSKNNLENESVEDAIVDLINYTVLLGGLIQERKAKNAAL